MNMGVQVPAVSSLGREQEVGLLDPGVIPRLIFRVCVVFSQSPLHCVLTPWPHACLFCSLPVINCSWLSHFDARSWTLLTRIRVAPHQCHSAVKTKGGGRGRPFPSGHVIPLRTLQGCLHSAASVLGHGCNGIVRQPHGDF